ncbi:transporter [Corynebacterium afermentans]|uniref:transporter n=1 Tax=Corynebacterium afermentans TaxID=38286 RepID=UPI002573C38C|nr:transporter [Corynebacterium afermentans]MCG7274786.1 transporter [Corynebacterium afermentans]
MTKTYRISGPKDDVAVDSLKDELSLVDGTHEVDLDLKAGHLTVVGFTFADEDIVQAAKNAGYVIEI